MNTSHIPDDVKARHSGISDCRLQIARSGGPKRRRNTRDMVSLVETMMKLHNSGYSTEDHIVNIGNMVGLVETTMTAASLRPANPGDAVDDS